MRYALGGCEVVAFPSLSAQIQLLPFYTTSVSAGFPSPAEDHLGDTLDLNQLLVRRPAATMFVRVRGDSMTGAGIFDGDILVVDRSLSPASGQIVIAELDGELTVKTLELSGGRVRLLPANPAYRPIDVGELQRFEVWGVVTGVVRTAVGGNVRAR